MRLLFCHIENFGKISNWDFEFKNGCNLICRENGWGKSTLAAFIRVMLYGFANQAKRSELENERRRYRPWQGGAYGGSLAFEVNGKRYLCHRIFGDKEKDDIFELRDEATGLKVNDFSERLGEELFQLDQDSFDRSICITQSGSDIRFTKTTGAMNAKLGNLVEDTEDINQFEKVEEKLTELLNAMSPRRRTGSLYKQREALEELRFQVRRIPELGQTVEELKAKRQQKLQEKEALVKEREQSSERQRRLVVWEKQKRYQALLEDCRKRQEAYQEQRQWFPGKLPDPGELEQKIKISGKLEENRSAMEIYRLTGEEETVWQEGCNRFAAGLPGQETLEQMKELARAWRENNRELTRQQLSEKDSQRLGEYQKRFSLAIPTQEELEDWIDQWEQRTRKQESLDAREANLTMTRELAHQAAESGKEAQKRFHPGISEIILGGLCMVASIYLLLRYQMAGVVGLLVGLVCVIAGILLGLPKGKGRKQAAEAEAARTEGVLDSLEQELRQDTQFIRETEAALRQYLSQYGIFWQKDTVLKELHRLREEERSYRELLEQEKLYKQLSEACGNEEIAQRLASFLGVYYPMEIVTAGGYGMLLQKLEGELADYLRIKEKRERYQERKEAYERQTAEVQEYLQELSMEPGEQLSAQLLEIQRHLQICLEREKNRQEAQQALDTYRQKEGEAVLPGEMGKEPEESADELREQQRQVAERLEAVHNSIRDYDRQIDDYMDEMEELTEKEKDLEEQERSYRQNEKKYRNLLATQKYLEQAKESLTEKYMQPLLSGIKKYYKMLTGEEAAGFRLDANANLTIEEQGLPRKPEFFSTGLRDLLGLCIRMALVDAMYQENAPFLLMDDPFVNYDDRKRSCAMEFLEKISEKYQILYFSCRENF